jgi:hypothetical protein
MQVPEQFLTEWKKNLDKGDKEKIAEKQGISVQTISRAFSGEASEDLILGITEYFSDKQQRLLDALKK